MCFARSDIKAQAYIFLPYVSTNDNFICLLTINKGIAPFHVQMTSLSSPHCPRKRLTYTIKHNLKELFIERFKSIVSVKTTLKSSKLLRHFGVVQNSPEHLKWKHQETHLLHPSKPKGNDQQQQILKSSKEHSLTSFTGNFPLSEGLRHFIISYSLC